MAPWTQIAKPFFLHFSSNLVKTVVGTGLIGYGVALALTPLSDDDENDKDKDKDKDNGKGDSDNPDPKLVRKCVTVTATIGLGLFFSLPSLVSQIVWETMIPGITATDIAYDLGTENVMGILPKWNLQKPKLASLVPSKDKIVGGLEAMKADLEDIKADLEASGTRRSGSK
jgi:hypothetical protein